MRSVFDRIWDGKGVREEEGPLDWLRLASACLGLLIVVWISVHLILPHIYDPKMGSAAAARALTEQLNNAITYTCKPMDVDAHPESFGIEDVDYHCAPDDPRGAAYYVGTDGDSITDTYPNP